MFFYGNRRVWRWPEGCALLVDKTAYHFSFTFEIWAEDVFFSFYLPRPSPRPGINARWTDGLSLIKGLTCVPPDRGRRSNTEAEKKTLFVSTCRCSPSFVERSTYPLFLLIIYNYFGASSVDHLSPNTHLITLPTVLTCSSVLSCCELESTMRSRTNFRLGSRSIWLPPTATCCITVFRHFYSLCVVLLLFQLKAGVGDSSSFSKLITEGHAISKWTLYISRLPLELLIMSFLSSL